MMGNVTFDRIECNLDLLPDALNFTQGYPLAPVSKPSASGPTALIAFSGRLPVPTTGNGPGNARKPALNFT